MEQVPITAGILFSIAAGAAALGNQLAGRLLKRTSARGVIAGCAAAGAVGAVVGAAAPGSAWLLLATPVFGAAMGTATTAAYTAAGGVLPATARGAGFGLLTTASLTGLAISPIFSGFLGATSIRAVFVLDAALLLVLGRLVWRLMVVAPLEKTRTPVTEEL
jgi:MFS family permease